MAMRWLLSPRPGADLDTLLAQADPAAPTAERHLWLVRLIEWLRHGETARGSDTPLAVLRLRHLLGELERRPTERAAVAGVLQRLIGETEVAALFADLGFTARRDLWGALGDQLRQRLLPGTPDSADLAELFTLFFDHGEQDAQWLAAIDAATLDALAELLWSIRPEARPGWRAPFFEALTYLVAQVRSAGFTPALRRRVAPSRLADRPFERLVGASEVLIRAIETGSPSAAHLACEFSAILDACRAAAASVHEHLDAYGISVDLVFEIEQLRLRTLRIEALLRVVLSEQPRPALQALVVELVQETATRGSLRAVLAQHYALLARKVVERSADTGDHYITRNRAEYRDMLVRAAGGGFVIGGTVFFKFVVYALGLSAFWGGFWAGANYALSFVIVHLAGWTVATKQPAMTAPALARRLELLDHAAREAAGEPSAGASSFGSLHSRLDPATAIDASHPAAPGDAPAAIDRVDAAVQGLVDEIAHLMRSQFAGIVGNLALVVPVVLGAQLLTVWWRGTPLIDAAQARHVLHDLTLLGPTAAYAAFTGVLLFAASLIAGWCENWFVWHRLDSAIAWNPGFRAVLGVERAKRWALWWRHNIQGLSANVSLGLLLGVVPVVAAFFALPIEVRHVTLATGQIAAAVGTLGVSVLREPALWWCVAAIPVVGALNLLVSFTLALRLALRARGVRLQERGRLYAALRQRLRERPGSFLVPLRQPEGEAGALPDSSGPHGH